ncbi:Exodeoxyribonuclease I [Vibrio stylophorae]|uniref:Exodeoxyribonuclease I n=1 Tax=Vibrio stylophorae TaxID=659351 RepID=A0ABM8ZSI2_9VIBR|nr:exodeoxyribonuclease I [Vibrio stylophorae]CAH0533271.1 Exodeoxyribonuclease I [Vibrio stylophorae]
MNNQHSPTFYFIDYETFGTHPGKDRPCQFAGIRTDMDLNIIGEPLVIYCRPTDDYLPTPEACLVTGITPQHALKHGLSEPEFIAAIEKELSTPNTCVVGYNNVRFDDEVTRYTLYRNFFEPYGWSWKNGNSRWDLLDVMRTCYALRPQGIQWPENEDGFTSFKLERLTVANGIEHGNAHDAMADVYATIAMAKLVKDSQPKLFQFLFEHRNKNKVKTLIDTVNLTPIVHVSGMLGRECSNISWMVPMAWHPTNQNAVIAVNLAMDPQPLLDLDAEALAARLYTKREDLAANELPVPVKLIHTNKCPVVAPAKTLTADDAARLNVDRQACLDNLAKLKQHPEVRDKLVALFELSAPEFAKDDVDTQLYDGFFTPSTQSAMEIIRQTPPEALDSLNLSVDDPRIAPLLFRYRARHFPHTLNDKEQQQWLAHKSDYFSRRADDYLLNLENLVYEHEQDAHKMAILKSVYQYAQQLMG